MEGMEIWEVLKGLPPVEIVSLLESILSLDCLKDPLVRESILQYEEQEDETRVEEYSEEEVFSKYTEIKGLMGDPLNLAQYLAEKREWEYESEGDMDDGPSWWEQFENEKTEHALKLLEDYEQRYDKEKTDE